MNCINCNLEISPSFAASIKDNKCPACGKQCLSEQHHGAIFSVVSTISGSLPDIPEDVCIKLATALHSTFDIFPKGVVVDGQATKEIVYVNTHALNPRKPPPTPVRKAKPSAESEIPGERLTAAQLSKLRQFQQMHEQDQDDDDSVTFDGPMAEDLKEAEAVRLAKQKIAKMRAEQAGVKG